MPHVDVAVNALNGQVGTLPRFKQYPAYKNSGVDWLGQIPAHWEVTRSKRLFRPRNTKTLASDRQLTASQQHGVIPQDEFMAREGRRVVQVITGADILKHVEPNDFVISMRSFQGGIEFSPYSGAISSAYVILAPSHHVEPSYFSHLLKSRRYIEALQCTSSLVRDGQALRFENFALVDLPFVPRSEQRLIAAFLDRETARIDALVAKKERLIELLQEKRAAAITRAVTKGLDANVPMKDSGNEWLGPIPVYWNVKPFTKCVVEKADYRGKTPEKVPSGAFLVTARNVRMGRIDYECSQEFVAQSDYDEIMRRGVPKKGDILLTTEAPLGNVALVDREDVALAQRIIRFRMNADHFSSRFTLFAMMSTYFQSQLQRLSTGSTAEGIKASKLPMLWLVAPPLSEQGIISASLEREILEIDGLVKTIRIAIDRLNERRTALISAAVTGKIDVREGGLEDDEESLTTKDTKDTEESPQSFWDF